MRAYDRPDTINIVYFSGTGGTKRVARFLADAFTKRGIDVFEVALNGRAVADQRSSDMMVVLYPVYALNAPQSIDDYIKTLPVADRLPTAVISVSGGGEVTPNTASRRHTIHRLQQKGYETVYEEMLVMPSNIFMEISDELGFALLRALPQKTDKIAADIVERQVVHRRKSHLFDRWLASIAEIEKQGSIKFGEKIQIAATCNGCGLCAKDCPVGNITMENKRPVYNNRCQMCLKCVYDCPQKALSPGVGKVAVIKNGYDLTALETRMAAAAEQPFDEAKIKALTKGIMLSGVRKYLLEK